MTLIHTLTILISPAARLPKVPRRRRTKPMFWPRNRAMRLHGMVQ